MDAIKKQIRAACKKASSYQAWRNPFGVWFVTLFDDNERSFFEFQYTDEFSSRDKAWVMGLFEKIDAKKKGEVKNECK